MRLIEEQTLFRYLNNIKYNFFKSEELVKSFAFTFFIGLCSCVTVERPADEYNLAKAALDSAKDYEGNRYAMKYLILAERNYKKAVAFYKDRDFDNAKKYFLLSKKYSEKTEDTSRMKQLEGGNE